jgi:hypothetical protein
LHRSKKPWGIKKDQFSQFEGEKAMMTQPGNDKKFRTITLEEHFATPEYMEGPGREMSERARSYKGPSPLAFINAHLVEQLLDLGDLRIADMDAAGIDMQVLSLNSPGLEQLDAPAAERLAHPWRGCTAPPDPFCRFRRYTHRPAGNRCKRAGTDSAGLWLQGSSS